MFPDDFSAVLFSQLADPFRIGLMAALIYTTIRNAAVTGWWVPIAAGIVFVAFIIATMFPKTDQAALTAVGTGLVANTIIALAMLGVLAAFGKISK